MAKFMIQCTTAITATDRRLGLDATRYTEKFATLNEVTGRARILRNGKTATKIEIYSLIHSETIKR